MDWYIQTVEDKKEIKKKKLKQNDIFHKSNLKTSKKNNKSNSKVQKKVKYK
tara:strand:- start:215 stop:367 length:153 start_codon:yes stop_codon:yes gene_type:complete